MSGFFRVVRGKKNYNSNKVRISLPIIYEVEITVDTLDLVTTTVIDNEFIYEAI